MDQQLLYCATHDQEKFQYFCLKEECIRQKPTECQLFYCPLCYEDLDENNQLFNHQIYDINILNKKNKKTIFKNKQAVGDKLWEMIKQKYNGNIENFENDCIQINQKFSEIKQKQLDNMISVQNHINKLKQDINQQLDQISKNIKVKIEEYRNLQNPTDIIKFINQKTSNFQELLGMLANEPKQNLQLYKNNFQNLLNSIRQDTYNLLIATQFSKQIKEQKKDYDLNIFLQYKGQNQEKEMEIQNHNNPQVTVQNKQQEQQQQESQQEQQIYLDENHVQLILFKEINQSSEKASQINDKISELKDFMNQIFKFSQTKTYPINLVLQNNLELTEQVQQFLQQQQQNEEEQQELNIHNKKVIQQYTDSAQFLDDFPAINNRQQYKKLSKSQINAITDLRVQLGFYYDFKNQISSYGYNSLGKQGVKQINEIIFNNLELKNLQNLSLNYNNSKLSMQEYLQMINQLGSWQLTPQIRKLSLGA
ncbi:hypothetical protein PPERSA_09232 [Pseudocohnilembus persalinus]|uniref:Uncharacterized protein n=1 Tax=Pseudocohnilembus persalinus TaxID=266149 RepID=A0A0V0R4E3_PSEPJ|nr:hypothetical protein PPERSA_09232 [Pseudocohnilembus persalinus]|eukprot:KRX09348.1 hypothetical protein PPERSA_09232 [Pseudocohnilembus persalinus]